MQEILYFIGNLLVELGVVTRIPGLLISGLPVEFPRVLVEFPWVPVEFPWVSFPEAFFRSASVCAADGSSVNRLGVRPWDERMMVWPGG